MNNTARRRRALKTRLKIDASGKCRLTVSRSNQHIYAQLIRKDTNGESQVLASASTNDPEFKKDDTGNKCEQAKKIGSKIAIMAKEAGIVRVAFDRSGYPYHGRIKALADSARENGLEF